jgi:C1A family cysteine protease
MATYSKSYTTLSEYNTRKSLYDTTDDFITTYNATPGKTMTVKHNRSSDWTAEEKAARLDPLKGDNSNRPTNQARGETKVQPKTQDNPDALDWRDYLGYSVVSPVRDQGSCGSCTM